MTKSFYFQHDYNAANDHRILFLRQQLGIEGYGIFWYILEQLAQSGGRLPMKIVPVLAMQIQTTAPKVNSVITDYDLFVIEDEIFFSRRLTETISWREELSASGKAGALKRWKKKPANGVAISLAISPANGEANSKGKEIKERKGDIQREIFSDELFITDLKRTYPGKDISKAWLQCWGYWIEQPNPPAEVWEWRRKLGTWLIRYKDDVASAVKNRGKIQ